MAPNPTPVKISGANSLKLAPLIGNLARLCPCELSLTEASVDHEDDDNHDIESTPHDTGFLKTSSLFKKKSPTGTSGMFP